MARTPRPNHAPPADIEAEHDFARGLASALLHCRELGHSWANYTASWHADSGTYDRALICGSCGTERHQILDAEGFIVSNGRYRYPDGYLAHQIIGYVGGRVPRNVFRKAALERATTATPKKRGSRGRRLKAVS
jgi:hypothetical protein